MKRPLVGTLVPLFAAVSFALAGAATAAADSTTSSALATATYTVTYTCIEGPGCVVGMTYVHTYALTVDCNLGITGTGTQADAPDVQEIVTGQLAFDRATRALTVNLISTYTTFMPGYVIALTGTVDPVTGALTGTATAGLPSDAGTAASFTVSGVRDSFVFNRDACGNGDEDEDPGDQGWGQ